MKKSNKPCLSRGSEKNQELMIHLHNCSDEIESKEQDSLLTDVELAVLRDNRNDTQHPEQNEADENNENNENNDSKDDSNNEESQGQSRFEIMNNFLCKRSLSSIGKFYILFVFFPVVVSLCAIYAAAIFVPPEARKKAPLFLWTDGGLILHRNSIFIKDKGYTYTICPRESICSEGWIQIFLILQYLDSLPLPLTFSWLIRFFPKYIAQRML